MKGRCEVCDKRTIFGHNVSHSNVKTNRRWRVNVQKTVVLENGKPKHIYACTRCIRTLRKRALQA